MKLLIGFLLLFGTLTTVLSVAPVSGAGGVALSCVSICKPKADECLRSHDSLHCYNLICLANEANCGDCSMCKGEASTDKAAPASLDTRDMIDIQLACNSGCSSSFSSCNGDNVCIKDVCKIRKCLKCNACFARSADGDTQAAPETESIIQHNETGTQEGISGPLPPLKRYCTPDCKQRFNDCNGNMYCEKVTVCSECQRYCNLCDKYKPNKGSKRDDSLDTAQVVANAKRLFDDLDVIKCHKDCSYMHNRCADAACQEGICQDTCQSCDFCKK